MGRWTAAAGRSVVPTTTVHAGSESVGLPLRPFLLDCLMLFMRFRSGEGFTGAQRDLVDVIFWKKIFEDFGRNVL